MSNADSTTWLSAEPSDAVTRRVRKTNRKKSKQPAEPKTVQVAPPELSSPLTHHQEFEWSVSNVIATGKRWFRSAMAAGYGVSLIVHAILLLIMSLVIVSDLIDEDYIVSSISPNEEAIVFDEVMDVRIDMPQGDASTVESLESAMDIETIDHSDNPVLTGVENSVDSLFEREGDNGLGGASFLVPKDVKIFRKGSFTAWTVPNDPKPGEDYDIVIVVKLPDRVKRYRASDLSGIVIGTDGYTQKIPGAEYARGKTYLPLNGREAQLIVSVPGAASRVRDTIEIRSKFSKKSRSWNWNSECDTTTQASPNSIGKRTEPFYGREFSPEIVGWVLAPILTDVMPHATAWSIFRWVPAPILRKLRCDYQVSSWSHSCSVSPADVRW